MQRSFASLVAAVVVLSLTAPVHAESGGIVDARAGLQDSHGWVGAATLQRYGTVRGLSVVFEYTFGAEIGQAQQPYDIHQVRYSLNHGPERQVSPVDAHRFACCLAQPGTHYVFKVQGCRKGLFGSDCTAWFERDFDTPPDATPQPPPAPAPLPRTPAPAPQSTPRHIVLPHMPAPTPVAYAINAPRVAIAARTRLQCGRIVDPVAKAQCVANVLDGKVLVTWTWQQSPCNALACYAADAFVVESLGGRTTAGPQTRSAWVQPNEPDGCVSVSAMHLSPAFVASGSACVPSRPSGGKPQ